MSDNFNGTLLCTISLDKSLKIFDVINFDMINMIRLDYKVLIIFNRVMSLYRLLNINIC